jgi:hypothetical protein
VFSDYHANCAYVAVWHANPTTCRSEIDFVAGELLGSRFIQDLLPAPTQDAISIELFMFAVLICVSQMADECTSQRERFVKQRGCKPLLLPLWPCMPLCMCHVANVVMAIIADFMLTWLPAPTLSFRPPSAVGAGSGAVDVALRWLSSCPDNAFQKVK